MSVYNKKIQQMHVGIKKQILCALHWAQLNELAHFTRARVLPCAQGIFLPEKGKVGGDG